MFHDKRSKKVVFVAHCILNQNTKLDECAHHPGPVWKVIQLLGEQGFGIIQLPCPELLLLGLSRQVDITANPTVMSEDTRIAKCMREKRAQEMCKKLTEDIIYQIQEYQKNEFEVIGIIGINGSPTCGVETTWAENKEYEGYGEFFRILKEELELEGIQLPMTGIKSIQPEIAVEQVEKMIRSYKK